MVGEVTPTVPQAMVETLLSNLSPETLTSRKSEIPTEVFDHHITEETPALIFSRLLGLILGQIIGRSSSSNSRLVSSIDLHRGHNSSHPLMEISKLIDHHSHIIILTNSLDRGGSSSSCSLGRGLLRTWSIGIGSMRNLGLLLNGSGLHFCHTTYLLITWLQIIGKSFTFTYLTI